MLLNRPLQGFFSDNGGSLTVEFVVTVPLLLAALTFSFEFARALWAYDVMTRDLRGGVRYFARSTASVSGSCSVPNAVQNLVKRGMTGGAAANDHFPWRGAAPTFSCSVTTFSSGFNQAVNVVTLTASVPVSIYFASFLNSFTGSTVAANYPISVSDQTRLVGN